jgi:hypothetical protein
MPAPRRLVELNRQPTFADAPAPDPQVRPVLASRRSTVQPPDYSMLADPAEEVLLRLQPAFSQLAAVPLIENPVAVQQDPPLTDD